jgi:hypothetical protein
MANLFNKSGKVHAPDFKYTGEEPDWHNWEKWTVEKFYQVQSKALRFYNYYLDSNAFKPIVLSWMKKNGYTKDEMSLIKDSAPWYLPTTVGKLIRMMDVGMPSIHPQAEEYFEGLLRYDEDVPLKPKDSIEAVDSYIRKALKTINADAQTPAVALIKQDEKKKITPLDRIRERVQKDILIYLDELNDSWTDTSKAVASLNLGNMLRDHKIPAQGLGDIIKWIERNLEEYRGAYEKTDPQLVEGYSYMSKPNLRKIVSILETFKADVESHGKIKNAMRKPRTKKPKAADKQVQRLKYQSNSAEYALESVSPSRIPYAQRLYIFNTKTRQIGVYYASGNNGFEVKGTSLKGFDDALSFHATLRKPKDILTGVLSSTLKKLDKIFDGVKITKKKANGRLNEHTIILKVLEHRP